MKMKTKGITRPRIAHPDSECDCCVRKWKAQMRGKGMILHLCGNHAAFLASASDRNGAIDRLLGKDN